MAALLRFLLLIVVLALSLAGNASADESAWSALRSGDRVVFIRHAVTDSGVGDPEGFRLGDCGTQRNLSAQGRADAKNIGEAFRSRNIPVADVLSSRWCRCLDTANLAFGKVQPAAMLDSMFNDSARPAAEKIREVHAFMARRSAAGNLILVTHAQNIQALTGVSPASGEIVVTTPEAGKDGKFKVLGRIAIAGR